MSPRGTRGLVAQARAGGVLGELGPLEDAPALSFTVPGPPVPWERVARGHVPPKTRAYKKHVGFLALAARTKHDGGLDRFQRWPLDAPAYAIEIDVYRVPPRGKQRRGDWDNYGKAIGDALTGVLYADDAAVLDGRVRIHACEAGRERAEVRVQVLAGEGAR